MGIFFRFYLVATLLMASICFAKEAEPSAPSKEKLAELVKKLSSEFLDEREKARDELVALGNFAEAPFLEALKSKDARVRAMAASGLGKIRSEKSLPALLKALKDPEGTVRLEVLTSLGKIATPEAIKALADFLGSSDESNRMRAENAIREALVLQPDSTISILLEQPCTGDGDEVILRGQLIGLTGKKYSARLSETLSKPYPFCDIAHEALLIIGKDSIPDLIKVLESGDPLKMRQVALLLGELCAVDAVPALIKALENKSRFPLLRGNCAISLGWIKDARAVKPLIAALKDELPEVRSFAAEALGEMKEKSAIPTLIEMLDDKNYDCRVSAIVALTEIKDPSAVDAIIKKLDDEEAPVCRAAAWALGPLKEKRAADVLRKHIDDHDILFRVAASKSLAQLDDQSGAETIIRAMHHWDGDVRRAAAYHSALIRDARPIEPLIKLLDDEFPYCREIALISLRRLTGQTLPPDKKAWEEWYAQNKNTLSIKSEEDTLNLFRAERSLQTGDIVTAVETYRKILEIDSNSDIALNNLAWIYATTEIPAHRHPAEALKMALRAVEINPIPLHFDTLAEAYFANGQIQEAINTIQNIIDMKPADLPYYQKRLADFKAALEKSKKAPSPAK